MTLKLSFNPKEEVFGSIKKRWTTTNNQRGNSNEASRERSGGTWDHSANLCQWGWLDTLHEQKIWLWEERGHWEVDIPHGRCRCKSATCWNDRHAHSSEPHGAGKKANNPWTEEGPSCHEDGKFCSAHLQRHDLSREMITRQARSTKSWLRTSVHLSLTQGCTYGGTELSARVLSYHLDMIHNAFKYLAR